MAIVYSQKLDIRGQAAEPVIGELLFRNKTIEEGLVSFETNIKAGTLFTENENSVVFQAYTCGAPSATGSFGLDDTLISPVKIMTYNEFCYDDLRTSRFNRDMASGAWNTISDEFNRTVLGKYADKIAQEAEVDFWSGVSSSTKTNVAALGTASYAASELSLVAGLTTKLYDGVVARMLYNKDKTSKGGYVGVIGATAGVTSANIATEYGKLYAAAPAVTLDDESDVLIYAPKSHKQKINIYNVNATYRDLFSVEGGEYFYNGVKIVFVPVPEDTMILSKRSHIVWATDLPGDITNLMIDKIANNRDDFFVKTCFTSYAHVVNQKFNVLYVKG